MNKDLVREILLAIEVQESDPRIFHKLTIPEYSDMEVSYHVMLLDEAGLIDASNVGSLSTFDWRPKRLTYQGHEFLESIRDPEIWQSTKAAASKVGGAGLSILWELAKAAIKLKLGLP